MQQEKSRMHTSDRNNHTATREQTADGHATRARDGMQTDVWLDGLPTQQQ